MPRKEIVLLGHRIYQVSKCFFYTCPVVIVSTISECVEKLLGTFFKRSEGGVEGWEHFSWKVPERSEWGWRSTTTAYLFQGWKFSDFSLISDFFTLTIIFEISS